MSRAGYAPHTLFKVSDESNPQEGTRCVPYIACSSGHKMRAIYVLFAIAAALNSAIAATAIETDDPLKAFVLDLYPRGSDYFINGKHDTTLFRCVADFNGDARLDIALSELSIWGNRTGPFDIFAREPNGRFKYLRTSDYESKLKALCRERLESCFSNDYLSTEKCQWKKEFAE
ncbi:hypothetical protein ACQE3E_16130 [Methylomonas sp. MED-D]|uniref:hypothetical protein n=1 Tax=Methylomonas sp. MED-D TaxID=3418768 RepID=UPI003D00DD22